MFASFRPDVIDEAAEIAIGTIWNYTLYAKVVFRANRAGDDSGVVEEKTVSDISTHSRPLYDEAITRSEQSRSEEENYDEHRRTTTGQADRLIPARTRADGYARARETWLTGYW